MGTDSGIKMVVCQLPDFIDRSFGLFEIDDRRGTDPKYNFRITENNDSIEYASSGVSPAQHPLRAVLSPKALKDFDKYILYLVRADSKDGSRDGKFLGRRVHRIIKEKEGYIEGIEGDPKWSENDSRNLRRFALLLPGMYQQWCHAIPKETTPPVSKLNPPVEEPKGAEATPPPPPTPKIWWEENIGWLIGGAVFCLCVGLLAGLWIATSPRFAGQLLDDLPIEPLFVKDPNFVRAPLRRRAIPLKPPLELRPAFPNDEHLDWKITLVTRQPDRHHTSASLVTIKQPPAARFGELRRMMRGPIMELDRGIVPSIQERLVRPQGMPFQPEFSSTIHHVRSRQDYIGERGVLARGMSRMGTMADIAAQRAQIAMNLRYGEPWELLELPIQAGGYRTTAPQREAIKKLIGVDFPAGSCSHQTLEKIRTTLWERYLVEGSGEERQTALRLLVDIFVKPTEPAVLV